MKKTALLLSTFFVFALNLGCNQNFHHKTAVADTTESSSIIGGEVKAVRNTAASRSVVLIELLNQWNQALTFCSATLIGPNTLMTAGHCFDPQLVAGVKNFRVLFENTYNEYGSREQRTGLSFSTNPQYRHKLLDNDIAVAIFSGKIPAGFAPVNIDTDTKADYSNELVYAYGYGRTRDYSGWLGENLRATTGTLYRGVLKINPSYKEIADRYFSVASWPVHICQGDSGGPQFYEKNGVLKVIGVNSAAYGQKLFNGAISCMGKSQAAKVAPLAGWVRSEEQRLLRAARQTGSEFTTESLETF